jgi:UDP:flavonoid glycosyltransferase YjiC (YdhE family)
MKLTLIAIGSRGDVQPIVALGCGLLDAGYAVRIVTLESFEPMVRGHGLEFFPVKGDVQTLTTETMLAGMKGNGLNLLSIYTGCAMLCKRTRYASAIRAILQTRTGSRFLRYGAVA